MICYLGDDDITRAAGYLSGVLQHAGIPFDRVDSHQVPPDDFLAKPYSLYIVSDYPRERFRDKHFKQLRESVQSGAGLLMIGGWESFHGLAGEYQDSPMAEMLPVLMGSQDDRHNLSRPVFLRPARNRPLHPALAGLPWETPPLIGGFNAFLPKEGAELLLEGVEYSVRTTEDGSFRFERQAVHPMLVLGRYGAGVTAALACDAAPHWVGPFVDWGERRVTQPLLDREGLPCGFVEVGSAYVLFFQQLFRAITSH